MIRIDRVAPSSSLVVVSLLVLASELGAQDAVAAARAAGIPEHEIPRRTVEEERIHKASLAPWQRKLNSLVLDRYERLLEDGVLDPGQRARAQEYSTFLVRIDPDARLDLELQVANTTPFDARFFADLGGQLVTSAPRFGLVEAWIPADALPELALRPDVRQIVNVGPDFPDVGSILTEGDEIHNADTTRTVYGVDGTGQLVGVISDGVTTLASAQSSGDLGRVTVIDEGGGDEGTAMLEIVADLSPGADLAFHSGSGSVAHMVNAIDNLVALGATVITDDLPKPAQPVYQDGPVTLAKKDAVAAGVFYTSSGGNSGQEHYQAHFSATKKIVKIGHQVFLRPHTFGINDFQLRVTPRAGKSPTFILQWAEPLGQARVDLDLYILDGSGHVLASSTNTQDGDDDPIEQASVTLTNPIDINVLIDVTSLGPAKVFFDLRGFNTKDWEYLVREGSVNGTARPPEVYAAGALPASDVTSLESFSAFGPGTTFFPTFFTTLKPNGCAVDRVSVTGVGAFGVGTCPAAAQGDCTFPGTSAATPHVAGLAALLREIDQGLSPSKLRKAFDITAVDIDLPGPDNHSGFGRIDVFAAAQSIRPLSDLDIRPGKCPNFFAPNAQGLLPIALTGTGVVDVHDVDGESLLLSRADGVGGSVKPYKGAPGPLSKFSDVATPKVEKACACHLDQGDGIIDLLMQFKSKDLAVNLELDHSLPFAVVELVLRGKMLGGIPFEARDCVFVVPAASAPGLLQVSVVGAHTGWIGVDPPDDNLDAGGFEDFDRAWVPGTSVTLSALPWVEGHPFLGWRVDGIFISTAGLLQLPAPQDQAVVEAVYGPEAQLPGRH